MPGVRCPVLAIQGYDDEYGTMAQLDRSRGRSSGLASDKARALRARAVPRDSRSRRLAAVTRSPHMNTRSKTDLICRNLTPRRRAIRKERRPVLVVRGPVGAVELLRRGARRGLDMSCTLCIADEQASIWIWQAQSR
jgi:hypothetical protein